MSSWKEREIKALLKASMELKCRDLLMITWDREEGKVIEEYSDDPRGKSCLVCSNIKSGRTIHVVCAPKDDYLVIITAYIPTSDKWEKNLKSRRKT